MTLVLTDKEVERLRKNHFGLSYSAFLSLVCEDCKSPCWMGEEHCEKMDRMRKEFGF